MNIRVAGVVKNSIVDGPGLRYVLFVQGCMRDCKGCHNPQTHDLKGGISVSLDNIFNEIKSDNLINGVTISGGEPLLQYVALTELARKIKNIGLNLIVYTGYKWEDIFKFGARRQKEFISLADIVIDGPFIENLKNLDLKFRGSSNQRVIDVKSSLRENKVVEINL